MRKLLLMLLVALSLGLVAGCGGDDNDDDGADAGADVDTLLEQTFSSSKDIDSGKLDVSLRASGAGLDNAIQADLSGPFQSEGDKQLPLVALSASLEGSGQSFEAGVTNTGEKGFVNFQGTDYEVSGPVYQQFKAAYEQTAADQQGQSLASLGIDPRKWLANAKNAGSADVGGTETIKITGDVDVAKLLDDVNAALQKLRSLGLQGSDQLPEQLTPAQKQQAVDAIKDINVEIYTGADDTILRRLLVTMTLQAPEQDAVDVELDISLLEVNEDQEIPEPSDAKPFSELAEQLGGLGLGGLGGSGGSGSDSGGGASQENLEKYSKCIQDAGADTEKARKCADLIAP